MLKRAALYVRVSTDRQAREGDSIPAQCEALRKYVADHDDLVLADEYIDDGISGQKFKERDELQRLLEDVKKKKIDIILFCKLDRWYRSIRHYTATQEVLNKYGVTCLAIWEPIYDTTTPSGRLVVNQMMSIAQFEAENTGQRIKAVFDYKIANGEVVSGSCPPGFSIKDKHLVPNEQADMIRDMFRYYSETNHLRQTMFYLESEYGFVRDLAAVKRYLSNELYKGFYRGNKHYCEPIVSEELFDSVQRVLPRNVKSNAKYRYIFTGMIVCAECGCTYRGRNQASGRGKNRRKNPIYLCYSRYIYHRCKNNRTIAEKKLEKILLERVSSELNNYIANYNVEVKKRKNVDGKIYALEEKIKRLKDLYVNGIISIEELKSDMDKYQLEIDALREEASRPERDLTELQIFLKSDFKEIYPTLTNVEKRQLWSSIIKEIRLDKDRNLSFIFL